MNEQEREPTGLWEDAEIISVYTRAQALEDGVLVARQAVSNRAYALRDEALAASVPE